jgi:DNA topoisomerase-2
MCFAKENSNKRKTWLQERDVTAFVDHNERTLSLSDFVNKELVKFSWADNVRSIPSAIDGLKPGHRKVCEGRKEREMCFLSIYLFIYLILSLILSFTFAPFQVLFSCFKRNLREEMKVAQLAGYVAEKTAYHHGETSLHSTIIGMAQNFVGSNNVPFLYPGGQFGTRFVHLFLLLLLLLLPFIFSLATFILLQ